MLNIVQKKGDQSHLDGHVTVYAAIELDPADLMNMKHPIASMVHAGFLVAQGNFKEQSSLRDFLKSEMGISMEDEGLGEGLAQLLEKMDGLESALDPQKLRDRLENMGELEEFIPTPAKIVPFHSEQEILSQDGDVFFVGSFKSIGNAVLSVNAVPIVYQAVFREQQLQTVRNEIESLIAQIERNESISGVTFASPGINLEEKLLKDFIPNMLYQKKDPVGLAAAQKQFRGFMTGYRFSEDVDTIISLISKTDELTSKDYTLLELYARKISLVQKEEFSQAELVRKQIEELRSS